MQIFYKIYCFCSILTLGLTASYASAAEIQKNPVVLELFTSQSCSSCPPADKVLQEFSHEPHVIALGYHVTYWNHLDWKDTLSSQESTNLQNEFNAGIGSNRVYTPQIVVNGQDEFVGSKRGKVADSVEENSNIIPLAISLNDSKIIANIPAQLLDDKNLSLMVVGFDKDITQSIGSGENSGEVVAYTHPVKTIDYIQRLKSNNQPVEIPIVTKSTGGYAVIIREGRAGKIIAAGQVRL